MFVEVAQPLDQAIERGGNPTPNWNKIFYVLIEIERNYFMVHTRFHNIKPYICVTYIVTSFKFVKDVASYIYIPLDAVKFNLNHKLLVLLHFK